MVYAHNALTGFYVFSSRCVQPRIPLPLHFALAEDSPSVPARQQRVGVPGKGSKFCFTHKVWPEVLVLLWLLLSLKGTYVTTYFLPGSVLKATDLRTVLLRFTVIVRTLLYSSSVFFAPPRGRPQPTGPNGLVLIVITRTFPYS
jgi:hypothetical protein